MQWWQTLLFPFALLYDAVTRLRNQVYDRRLKRTVSFDTNVVAVGNLTIGGTGKTPLIDYLIRHLMSKGNKVATLSRGYGRRTSGFRLTQPRDTPETVGDEPYMYYKKYNGLVSVAVGEERDLALSELLLYEDDIDVVLLDDAFQHRRVDPSVKIMLTRYSDPFYEDYLLPAGRLRESRRSASRADIIIVTKCPDYLSEADQVKMRHLISKYSSADVFFAGIEYLAPVAFAGNEDIPKSKVIGISGMAYPKPFIKHLRSKYEVRLTHNYRDHHRYTPRDIKDITQELNDQTSLITTEKDMVKLERFTEFQQYSCFYIPIRMKFLKDEALFVERLHSYLKKDVGEDL